MIKNLIVPVAAFAITVTSVSAFNNVDWSKLNLDLSDAQVSALEEVQEIRQETDERVKEILEEAGIDQEKMREIRQAQHESAREAHQAIKAAVESGDYEAFKAAIVSTPMAEVIDTEAEFNKLKEAHELKEAGDFAGAKAIMEELGLNHGKGGMGKGRGFGHH